MYIPETILSFFIVFSTINLPPYVTVNVFMQPSSDPEYITFYLTLKHDTIFA
jgi:hypothetical protein